MATPKALPLLCLLCFFFLFSSPEAEAEAAAAAEAAKADFFYLTLLWPGTLCSNSKCCTPTTGEPAADFSVQALESYNSAAGKPVTNCFDSSCRFFVNSLRPFIDDMYAHWADLSCPSNNGVDLWRSTWCTYGTCSNLTQVQYFQGALNLTAKIDLLNVLAFYDIVPSKKSSYKLEDIQSSLVANYGFSTVVECSKSWWFGEYNQLSKVQFCVSADAQRLISCPLSISSNCAAQVKFPPFTVNKLQPCLGSKPVMLSAEKDLVM